MKLQVLVAAVGRKPEELLSHMRLQSDAIVINQCDRNGFQSIEQNGHEIRYYDFAEKGVGLSRNNALLRADGDIVLFSDEDIVYDDGYEACMKDHNYSPELQREFEDFLFDKGYVIDKSLTDVKTLKPVNKQNL